MKKLVLLALLLSNSLLVFSQKVDIDDLRIYISNVRLPRNHVPEEDRFYRVLVSGNSSLAGINQDESIYLYGWEKVNENPKFQINVTMGSFLRGKASLSERTEEKKDKDGKVISTTKKYSYYVTNRATGNVRIFGYKNELPKVLSEKELELQKKKELKEQEKQAKKEKETSSNPFLANASKSDPKDDDPVSGKNMAYYWDLDKSYEYSTATYTTSSAALKEFNSDAGRASDGHEADFRENYANWVRNDINRLYGYSPSNNRVKFKRLDSKKHPEYETYENATNAMKVIFEKMRYNKPINYIEEDLQPIIDYFEEVTKRYASDDKQEIKLREASIYNLARIYQYLDQHDKVIDYANRLYETDKKSKDAKNFIKESTEIQRQLEFHHMKSRHIVPKYAADEKDELGEETETIEEDN
ncbi:MAG TPA: hypothetical protein DCQ58_01760 [Saprospirales bacterium]|nr:hypothetical protein [Saprospirales bacterium]